MAAIKTSDRTNSTSNSQWDADLFSGAYNLQESFTTQAVNAAQASITAATVATVSADSGSALYAVEGTTASTKTTGAATVSSAAAASSYISVARESYIARPNGLYNMGTMFNVNPTAAGAPAMISLNTYDRNNYAGAETYNYGTMTARNGCTYQPGATVNFNLVNGQYVTSNGLKLTDFTFSASTQENRTEYFQLTAYNAAGKAMDARSVEIVTHATTTDLTPGVSSAAEVAKVAQSFIGKVWDSSGCWNLASDIAATAGGSLCFNSGWITPQVSNNGQWTVSYDAYNGVNNSWMSGLQAGDIVELGWKNANYGHIFTIDRVTNGQAYLVDNSGASVKGGDPSDVYIAEQSLASYAPYINQSTVVVFRDNGPVPTPSNLGPTVLTTPMTNLTVGSSVAASSLFRASDADYDAITQYAVRDDTTGGGYFTLNGVKQTDGQWITVDASKLSQLAYHSSATASVSDTIEVEAYDGKTWGQAGVGRVASLASQVNGADESSHSLGVVGSSVLKATEWVGSTDKYDWWTFTVSGKSTAVDIQLSHMTGQANLNVFGPNGNFVGSAYGYAYDNSLCQLSGTLAAGTYTVRIDQYLGNTDYDLQVGLKGTLANPTNPAAAFNGTPTPSGKAPGAAGLFADTSLAWADSSGLGTGGSGPNGLVAANQNDKGLLASQS